MTPGHINWASNTHWDVRTGIIFDPTPVPDETLDPLFPSGDRFDFSLGVGFKKGAFKLDAAYLLVTSEDSRFFRGYSVVGVQ